MEKQKCDFCKRELDPDEQLTKEWSSDIETEYALACPDCTLQYKTFGQYWA